MKAILLVVGLAQVSLAIAVGSKRDNAYPHNIEHPPKDPANTPHVPHTKPARTNGKSSSAMVLNLCYLLRPCTRASECRKES